MAQAKKKTATKTTKRATRPAKSCRKATCCKRENKQEKLHVYVITALSLVAGILLFANAAMMMV